MSYRGRFAPSPTGPLHRGSLVAALASWLDARAHQGRWLVRIEDIDPAREQDGAARAQLDALARLGLTPDEPAAYQSARSVLYEEALARLAQGGHLYLCSCSRAAVELAARREGLPSSVYPGTCRHGPAGTGPAALRVRVPAAPVAFDDRACGHYVQLLERDVGDFVVRRADGLWSYQLAVVVDDAQQGITDVVRGADLLDNTPRQIHLQRLLGLPTPRYLHVPLVRANDGEKLSKQNGAEPLDLDRPLRELQWAWRHLGFERLGAAGCADFLRRAVQPWRERWGLPHGGADTIPATRSERAIDPGAGPGCPA